MRNYFQIRKEHMKFYLLLLTAAGAVFCLIPFELYHNQPDLWNYSRGLPFGFALGGLVCFVIASLVITPLFNLSEKCARCLCLLIWAVAIYILLADLYAPLQVSDLDGTALRSEQPWSYTLIELGLLLGIVAVFVFVRLKTVIALATITSWILLLITTIYAVLITQPVNMELGPKEPRKFTRMNTGNVYHIVLDELQTDAALLYLKEEDVQGNFEGFTIFPYNVSNYLYTKASFPSYISGTTHTSDAAFAEWQAAAPTKGFFPTLYHNNYQLTVYSPRHSWRTAQIDNFHTLDDVFHGMTSHLNIQYKDFFLIWFARLMPNAFTNRALHYGKLLAIRTHNLSRVDRHYPDTIGGGREPYSSVLMLKQLIASEKNRPADGQYVYAHAIIPHGPYVMDEQCHYRQTIARKRAVGYYKQISCAFGLINDFFDELKRLGRFDAATIFLHSDTGHGHQGYIRKANDRVVGSAYIKGRLRRKNRPIFQNNEFKWSTNQVLSRALSFLAIKPANSQEQLRYSTLRSQLTDLYPTAIDLLNLETDQLPYGSSLFSPDFPKERKSHFIYYPSKAKQPLFTRIDMDDFDVWPRISNWVDRMQSESDASGTH